MINSIILKLKNILLNHQDPELLTGGNYNYQIEKMFDEANAFIYIISPYIKLNRRIVDILKRKQSNGVSLYIITRENKEININPSFILLNENLHAKLYISDKSAILGSMNLYTYSQENNYELGVLINQMSHPILYDKILNEAKILCQKYKNEDIYTPCNNNHDNYKDINLGKGKFYTRQQIISVFHLENDIIGGINQDRYRNIILISNSHSKYKNIEKDGIIYFCGQNTGKGIQKLKYGNQILYDAYKNPVPIYYFKDNVYIGEKVICDKPYQMDGIWIFPLKDK